MHPLTPFLLIIYPYLTSAQDCVCRPKSQCNVQFNSISEATRTTCTLPGGSPGFCCRDVLPSNPKNKLPPMPPKSKVAFPSSVSGADISNSLSVKRKIKPKLSPITVETTGHNQFTKGRKEDKDVSEAANSLFHLRDGLSLRQSEGFDSENSVEVNDACPWTTNRRPRCDNNARFRTVDGSCNNKANPLFGLSGTPFQRILHPTYPLGDNTPRTARDGSQLPSARHVSQVVFNKGDRRDNQGISAMFMQFGQFIDHDLTHTPTGPVIPQCCLPDRRDRDWIYPDDPFNGQQDVCFPIEVLRGDSFWGPRGRRCMHLQRSDTSPSVYPAVCEGGRWEQRNALTHWLDGSQIYGSTETESEDVRDPRDRALLAVSGSNSLLPTCADALRRNREPESCSEGCGGCTFVAGDLRVNEQPGLTVQHNAWIREHNRVAVELRASSPTWNEERVFQEARRVVVAQWQHVVYNEWLPILLGPAYMRSFNLQPSTSGYSLDYDPLFDPRINNEFATAAFRFAHSMVTPNIPGRDSRGNNNTRLDLRNVFDNSVFLQQRGFIEDTVRGQSQDIAPALDGSFVDDIVNHLFEDERGADGGLDLTALNIQRGRDHGIPGYNEYREQCASSRSRFGKAGDFRDLSAGDWISQSDIRNLREVYNDIEDIDLFVGGIIEKPHKDGLVGPTFKCIIGDQFTRLRRGDRFFYEHGFDRRTSFTPEQLDEIRKTSMARVMCDNTDITRAQPLMFRVPGEGNDFESCSSGAIPKLNLDVFTRF